MPLVSLAAGTVLDVAPPDAVDVAAAAGFDSVGLWFDASMWTDATTTAVAARLRATGIAALDLEPIIFGRGDDHGERMIAAAVELGVPNVLVASGGAPRAVVVARLTELAAFAERAGPVVLSLEFLPIFSIGSLAAAVSVVREVEALRTGNVGNSSNSGSSASPGNLGVLVDVLHLDRSGGAPGDIVDDELDLFRYVQWCDAPALRPVGLDELREEALHGRLLPGDGTLPLAALLERLPGRPLSLELRSRALMTQFPDPIERARAVRRATDAVLAECDAARHRSEGSGRTPA